MHNTFIPKKMFFVKGTGTHQDELISFEEALRDAGIEKFNLVSVSSIFPPACQFISKSKGLKELEAGQIIFCVMARNAVNKPHCLISSSIGLAVPEDKKHYGYLSEHHAFGKTAKISGDYAEDLAATMLATALGIKFNPKQSWRERKRIYKASSRISQIRNISKSAKGDKNGLWTTAIAAAVFIV